ncbi:MAG: phenylalanine--tRNA ligase subunit beta [Candidatus Nealsonbacteria bacterium]
MVFSYNWLKEYIKGKLPGPEKLAELLAFHAFEVEEVKKSGKDFILDIDILPDRAPDCFSHFGIAREIAAITGNKFKFPESNLRFLKEKAASFLKVENTHKSFCLRYTAMVLKDVKVALSPKWMQERLETCGLRSINNIVDIANYVMLETGQPLHAFDGEKLEGRKIVVRFAKNGEKFTTLDDQKFTLDPDILVIADSENPVAIAGIKGGKTPEISNNTKIVVLESANFEPRTIRRGSKKLDLKTDASLRFEHGLDPNLTEFAIKRAAYLIQKLAGGKALKGLIDVYPKKASQKRIKLDFEYLKSLLGINIPKAKVLKILKDLEFKILGSSSKTLTVQVPTFRLDVSIPEDLIEEIGRVYGYEKIKADFPRVSLIPPKRNLSVFWENIVKDILKEAGFTEIYNYSFFGDREANIFSEKKEDLIELENPLNIEQKYLRTSLIPNLIKNVERNFRHSNNIRIFEIGKIFKNLKETKEKRMITGVIKGDAFYQGKGVVDLILRKLGISNIWYDEYEPTPEDSKLSIWHQKKCAEIKVDKEEIGFLGEVSPKITQEMKIPEKVVVFDLDFEKLSNLASEEHEYRPISRFPASVRDLAVLVSQKTKVVQVLNKINAAGGSLVRDIDLFDIYEGEELPEGKKNLAFHVIYQAEDKTLKSKEVDDIHQKIINALEEDPEWEVRK